MDSNTRSRALSSPELHATSPEDYSLEGIATNVKLLLKLIQEHNGASTNDERKTQRIAGMMTILDDVKARVEKSFQSKTARKRLAELRRCNTELRPSRGVIATPSREKKPQEPMSFEEFERVKKQLSASLAARKSLEIMCSSLGKEKNIMSCELSRKNSELHEMEELVNDLRAQNQNLLAKLQSNVGNGGDNLGLEDRNKVLMDQLVKSLETYRSLKRKYKAVKYENYECHSAMEEIGVEVNNVLRQIQSFGEKMESNKDQMLDVQQEVSGFEQMFERFHIKVSKHLEKNNTSAKPHVV